MASGSFDFLYTNTSTVLGRVNWSSTSNGPTANTSTVVATVQISKTNSINTMRKVNIDLEINGNSKNTTSSDMYTFNNSGWTTVATHTVTVPHNADGTKSTNIKISGRLFGGSTGSDYPIVTKTQSITLDNIPRYPSIDSWSLGSATHNSFKSIHSVSPAGSTVHYRIGSGSWVAIASGGTVSGLSPGTAYSITLRATHPSSGLTTESGPKSITTLEIASSVSLSHSSRALGRAITITITRGSTSYTHTIQHNFSGSWVDIATGVATSQSWTLPASLANYITSATSKAGSIRVRTYRGGTHIGDATVSLTATVPDNATYNPSISGLAASIYGSGRDKTIGKYVQGISRANVGFTASLKYGATAVVQKIRVDTTDFNGNSITTVTLSKAGTITITATLTDSRGRTITASINITVHAYTAPRITVFSANRVAGTKNATVARSVTFTGLSGDNPLSMLIRIRPVGGSWSNLQNLTGQTSNITGSVTATGLVDTSSYEVTITVTDSFGRSATADVVFGTVAIALTINKSMGIGVGKVHEGKANLEVSGTAEINGSPIVYFADYEEW